MDTTLHNTIVADILSLGKDARDGNSYAAAEMASKLGSKLPEGVSAIGQFLAQRKSSDPCQHVLGLAFDGPLRDTARFDCATVWAAYSRVARKHFKAVDELRKNAVDKSREDLHLDFDGRIYDEDPFGK